MDGMDYLKGNLRLLSASLAYGLDEVVALVSNRWTWMGLGFITTLSFWRCRGVKGFDFGFSSWGTHAQGSYVQAAAPACLIRKILMLITEKSLSFTVAKSAWPSSSTSVEDELESPTSDEQLDCLRQNLIRFSRHEKIWPANEFRGRERRSLNEPKQDRRGKIKISSDIIYDVGWKEKCKGSLFIMNDHEGGGRRLGPCLSHSCVDLGVWQWVESFEHPFGLARLQSLRLGYDLNWNFYRGESVLNLDKLSKYPVRYMNVANALDSPTRSLVKLLSLREDAVTSVDMVWDMGLSSISTIDNTVRVWDIEVGKSLNKMMVDDYAIVGTVRVWDIEVGKSLNKMMVDDYAIVGSHIGDNPGFILNGIMMREEKGSLFVWDRRDFQRPLNFCVGNMSTIQSVHLKDNKVYVSDCVNEKQFDLRMIHHRPKYAEEKSLLYCH